MIMPSAEIPVHERKDAFHFQRDCFIISQKVLFVQMIVTASVVLNNSPVLSHELQNLLLLPLKIFFLPSVIKLKAPALHGKNSLVVDEFAGDRWFNILKKADFRFLIRESPGKNHPP
ncbi:hypothetical protein NC99_42400 [Sunxiuqinia dokdonensis]|uniref:Uncharacterized protein n=1 Tax=Sunxiuqinia dokdonensis TaxID=1409788 RepID=A0A0L8V3I5_9BACT|nr:hypothetical protein NC99_42400 [Sunxiuqinia dokdonensis]